VTASRLSAEVRKALQAPDLRERYLALGMDPVSITPEELAALLKREIPATRASSRKPTSGWTSGLH
jgi:tripartite-type tricarboxylate transporter receptor subunit TctC